MVAAASKSPPRGASLKTTQVSSKVQALVDHLILHDFNTAFLQTPPLPAPFPTSLSTAHPQEWHLLSSEPDFVGISILPIGTPILIVSFEELPTITYLGLAET